ncbi:hypothetical protein NEIPOLOT_02163 [Neisseria polysaccharea ATCC 43768]|nr:hypothetical protein NEIPOLOT_02163 [Neisseria polysaccharea ATCC 43768]
MHCNIFNASRCGTAYLALSRALPLNGAASRGGWAELANGLGKPAKAGRCG